MTKRFTRRGLIVAAAPLAAVPLAGRLAVETGGATTAVPDHTAHRSLSSHAALLGHAAMIGDGAPAVGGPNDLDHLLYPPPR